MPPSSTRDRIIASLARGEALSAGDVARAMKISRQMAHRHLTTLVAEGRLVRDGAGRAARYRSAGSLPFVRRYPRAVISEDRVWDEVAAACPAVGRLQGAGRSLFQYAFTEMLNNAIEHSRGREVEVLIDRAGKGALAFEVIDDGVGLFRNVRRMLGFQSDLEALQQVSKGKLTTLPAGHTGEGLFFTSKAARRFEVHSGTLRWIVDNVIGDTAVGSAPARRGTRVRFEGDVKPRKTLAEVFAEYTEDFALTKTRVVVKLFTIGVRFISRSEARRLLVNLERFRTVVLDFTGVEEIGQGFADEVFRVWAGAHPAVTLQSVGMSPPVAFMIEHARRA
jgi:uncharacterized protein DUF4325/histidine kinase/DNA gyrase B/HSP90-like ATPase